MILNRTELALIARGVQSDTARVLREQGWTLAKLSGASDVILANLGLHSETIKRLRNKRPSIPMSNLIEVLFANRFLCCVCRNHLRPVVVHHIDPWSRTRDHSVPNLAVLCPIDHGKAHSTRDLEQTLSAPILRHFKQNREDSVKRLDPIAIQKSTQPQSDQWLYFNHLRIFELAADNGIDLVALSEFLTLHNPNGIFLPLVAKKAPEFEVVRNFM